MRTEHLIESKPKPIRLTDADAASLNAASVALATNRKWWGDSESSADRPVVRCSRVGFVTWEVTVRDAIGIAAASDLPFRTSRRHSTDARYSRGGFDGTVLLGSRREVVCESHRSLR